MNIYDKVISKVKRTVNTYAARMLKEQGLISSWSMVGTSKPLIADDIVLAKGSAEYQLMMKDPDVKAAISTKVYGVLAKGYQISPPISEDEPGYDQAQAQAEFVEMTLELMPGNVTDRLKEILRDCVSYGGSVSEKLWGWGDGLNYLMLKDIKVKDPNIYKYDQDEYGNLTKLILNAKAGDIEVDMQKFIRVAYNAEHGNPYGDADLRSAYLYWFIKAKLVRWWACYLEKFAMPPVKGTLPNGSSQTEITKLRDMLDSIQQETSIVITEDVQVELMETAGKTSGEFSTALDYFGKQITKAILGQTLATEQNSKTGSLAQAKVHQDTLISYITELKSMIETVMNEQVIRDIIDYNFTDRFYPNFILPLDEKDIQQLAGILYQLITCGEVTVGESWTREWLGVPEREEVKQTQTQQDTRPPKRSAENEDTNAGRFNDTINVTSYGVTDFMASNQPRAPKGSSIGGQWVGQNKQPWELTKAEYIDHLSKEGSRPRTDSPAKIHQSMGSIQDFEETLNAIVPDSASLDQSETYFLRATPSLEKEIKLGQVSTNKASGGIESGLSAVEIIPGLNRTRAEVAKTFSNVHFYAVSNSMESGKTSYIYVLKGKQNGIGSDNEPTIDPKSITIVAKANKKLMLETNPYGQLKYAKSHPTALFPAHRDMIEKAVKEGKPVPQNVKDEYGL